MAAGTLKPEKTSAAGRAISASVAPQQGQRVDAPCTPLVEKEL